MERNQDIQPDPAPPASETTGAPRGPSPRSYLDFSVSVNPLGPTKKVKAEVRRHLKHLDAYPDPACFRLRRRIGQIYGLPPETLFCANGTDEILRLLADTLKPRRALVMEPAVSRYARVMERFGGSLVDTLRLDEGEGFRIDPATLADKMAHADIAFLSNPNDPTGGSMPPEEMEKLLTLSASSDCLLLIDEAFIDFQPEGSVLNQVGGSRNRIVLRSLSNYHGLAGLRIAFAVMHPSIREEVENRRDSFSVNTLAQRAAYVALGDKVFHRQTLEWLREEKPWLQDRLEKLGFIVYPSAANFLLVRHENAAWLRQGLDRRGIGVQDGSTFTGLDERYLRIAVRNHKENALLIRVLSALSARERGASSRKKRNEAIP